jgi:MFS family permease
MQYTQFISTNRNFRWLWSGMIVSLFGDWFNTIALYEMVGTMSKSPLALAWVFVLKVLPFAFFAPFGGLIADRFDRRKLMMHMDLLRAICVFALIVANETHHLTLVYIFLTLQVMAGAIFQPAYQALLPNIVSKDDLLTASALLSGSWSILLAVGSALGGLALTIFPRSVVLLVDSLSYLFSMYCVWKIVAPKMDIKPLTQNWIQEGYEGIAAGWRLMKEQPRIGKVAVAKATWSSGGAALVFMLSLLGMSWMPSTPALGIGILYSARGLGTGIGPLIARRFFTKESQWVRVMGIAVVGSGLTYLSTVWIGKSWIFLTLLVCIAHAFSGINWVLSSVTLQKRTPDAFRGRVMSTELLFVTFVEALVTLLAGFLLERIRWTLSECFIVFACVQMILGAAWLFWVRKIS